MSDQRKGDNEKTLPATPAEDVFKATMSDAMIARSEARFRELESEFAMLGKLRKARKLTQRDVAAVLGKSQVAVANLEKRSDVLVSTLKAYVAALGGTLELTVRFDNGQKIRLGDFGQPIPGDGNLPA